MCTDFILNNILKESKNYSDQHHTLYFLGLNKSVIILHFARAIVTRSASASTTIGTFYANYTTFVTDSA